MKQLNSIPLNNKRKPKGKIDLGKATMLAAKGMKQADIARVFDVSRSAVHQQLRVFNEAINSPLTKSYNQHEEQILQGAKAKFLAHALNDDKLKNAPAGTLALMFCQMYDKHALHTGRSTQNISIRSISEHYQRDRAAIMDKIREISSQDKE